jgi:ankyrin repeat protein
MLSTAVAQSLINYQNALGATALIFAAGKGHESVTKQLLEARCNVDLHETKFGFTPLHFASANGHATVLRSTSRPQMGMRPSQSSVARSLRLPTALKSLSSR